MAEVRDLFLHYNDDQLSVFDPLVTYLLMAIIQLIKLPLSCRELFPGVQIKAVESLSGPFQTGSDLAIPYKHIAASSPGEAPQYFLVFHLG